MARNSWSSYRILIAGGSGTGKANALLYLLNNEPDNDKVYSYAKNRMKQNRNYQLTKEKVQTYSILMIQKLLLNTHLIWTYS